MPFGLDKLTKDAGLSAAQELHRTADDALQTVDHETIPAAEAAAKAIVGESVNGIYGILVDVLNRLNGAELPIDITIAASATIRITGKIGALKLSMPQDSGDAQQVAVQG